ncbi:hypothetical protein J5N97_020523 [Dioscorea zingiberensis]|uniref:Core Histone H2A/H2B/H3 domain-containing protein n=1 Tax=Dioscorea zingiberensis TaxID=325984 RepID=A0A9D5CGK9_9LILI|nr:hypothetical protein J5N97_020523 [Dioscorea zingiberensis]
MKADEDVRMISAEAPILFAKACELFILELTIRSWLHAEENKRRTLQKNDIAAAITRTDIFDFLVDIVPRDEIKEEGAMGMLGPAPVPGAASSSTAAAGVPYYYTQPPPPPGVMMGQPAMPGIDPSMYMQRPWPPVWQQGVVSDESSPFGGATGMDDGQGYVSPPPPPPPPPPSQ